MRAGVAAMTRRDSFVGDPETLRTRLLAAKCKTCIYRRGNKMHLAPGGLDAITRDALARDGHVVCHSTLPGIAPDGVAPAVCRGFYDLYRARSAGLRLIAALFGFTEVDPPEGET